MVERTDIDALLISALYGELTPAQESQLTAHLESHPGDRTALEGLTRTRAAVRESRILEVRLEPPQSVSAMLMQEAARRSPKAATEGESWFARFVRSFMQHPAMAAAATLVLVIGIATVVSRKGGELATQTVDTQTQDASDGNIVTSSAPSATTPSATTPSATAPTDERGGAASFQVKLEEKAQKAQGQAAVRQKRAETGVALDRDQPMPKELAEKTDKTSKVERQSDTYAPTAPADSSVSRSYSGYVGIAGSTGAPAPAAPAPTLPPSEPRGGAGKTATIAIDAAKAKEALGDDTKTDTKTVAKDADPNFAWARDQHDHLRALVKANNCAGAAGIALAIADRAPAYYQQNVATDRSVKECHSYIAQKLEQRNEVRAQRERAKNAEPKRAIDEAKPTTTK